MFPQGLVASLTLPQASASGTLAVTPLVLAIHSFQCVQIEVLSRLSMTMVLWIIQITNWHFDAGLRLCIYVSVRLYPCTPDGTNAAAGDPAGAPAQSSDAAWRRRRRGTCRAAPPP